MLDYKTAMGQRIKIRRKELKLTQEIAAEEIGVSVKHFSEVERGIAGLSIENLIKLSNLLGISIDYIIKGDVDKSKWESIVSSLQSVPTEKEHLINELISLGIKLSK